jgi:uncharacterized protein with FMN-binding domain
MVESKQPAAYYAMIGLSLVAALLAVITLLPNPAASKPNVLGYRSVCSFAPASSALLGLLAGASCTIRNRRVSRRAASARYQPLIVPIAAAVALLAVFLAAGIHFLTIQSRFGSVIPRVALEEKDLRSLADGTRRATVEEGDIRVTVEITVTGGRIEDLKLTEAQNVEPALAGRLFEAVRAAQSTRVDAVAGATASSRVLLKAIEAAAVPAGN